MTGMDELIVWLREQLVTDERLARHRLADHTQYGASEWDPDRVLADVDAKRRILDLHEPVIDGTQSSWAWFEGSESKSEAIVRLLALPYAGRDGYREEWRP